MKFLISENSLVQPLDHLRIAALRLLMKIPLLRQVYCDRANRLGFNFLLFSGLYLVISLKWSIVLLVLGPMVLGYPHLVSSYRFLQKPVSSLGFRFNAAQVFQIFIFLTGISLCIRFIGSETDFIPELPYGSWEILLSITALGLIQFKISSIRHAVVIVLTLLIAALALKVAWHFPIAFVGFALIFHNWVAFGYWFLSAQDLKNRIVVLLATTVFAMIHILVFNGVFDALISFPKFSFLTTQSFEASGWVLASWTSDPLIWNRMIVIYTFGLSMHYFVWLSAIPQSLDQKAVPNSFRRSLEQLRKDCGQHTTVILFVVGMALAAVWIFTSAAGPIYFALALLHGWLEFIFFVVAALSFSLRVT